MLFEKMSELLVVYVEVFVTFNELINVALFNWSFVGTSIVIGL